MTLADRTLCPPVKRAAAHPSEHTLDEIPLAFAEILPQHIPPSLLLDADPSASNIATYLLDSWCFGATQADKIIGACVVTPLTKHSAEISNVAVASEYQGQGVGTLLLSHVIQALKARKIKRLELGTGAFGYQLAFYQRMGFRVESVVKNHFLDNYEEPIWENGIQHKDMLRLSRDL